MAKKRETKRQQKIQKDLRKVYGRSIWILKVHGGPFQKAGIGDLLVCCHGLFFNFEVKEPDGAPAEIQLENLRAVRQAGGQGWIIETSEEAIEIINRALAKGLLPIQPYDNPKPVRRVSTPSSGVRRPRKTGSTVL